MNSRRNVHWSLSGLGILSLMLPGLAAAAEGAPAIKWGAFVDTYYAYDFKRPGPDRIALEPANAAPAIYSTQPVRHNEFNLNLAFLEAKLEAEKIRGRLAFQVGNSVQANYAAESAADQSRLGGAGAITRYVQEAVVGYAINPRLWVDAGIYFSHIGLESFISRDNWAYTRSLGADNSPYYQSGVRFSYAISDAWSAQLHLINGWQNVNENNGQKAVGTQVAYAPNANFSLTYNTFIGYEAGSRIFQDLVVKYTVSPALQFAGFFDYGLQRTADTTNDWYVAALLARIRLHEEVFVTARAERFFDPRSSVVSAGSAGFRVWGGSLGVDWALHPSLTWRNEVRLISGPANLFPARGAATGTGDSFVVSSLALSI